MSTASSPRVILFLMGPSTPFWRELSLAFEAAGHRTVKVCFSLGDWLYWRRRGAYHFRGRLSRWPAYVDALVAREGITDVVLYADQQPYHLAAGDVARARGLQVISIENGYLRPDWITVERDGMGVRSHFPNDPVQIRAIAAEMDEPDLAERYRHGFWTEMFHEGAYQMTTYFWRVLYPFYRTGKYYDPLLELLVGIPKLWKVKASEADAAKAVKERLAGSDPFYVVALQLQGDYQIRSNSPYRHIREMVAEVMQSFAKHAPEGSRLIVKQHPHDNGWENWSHLVRHLARHWGVHERVDFIDGGDLGALLRQARGCVMINSTVGLFSIRHGCPTKILGVAIYDMPGLTHQGSLDDFWASPEPVDASLAQDFVRALAATIQVKGDFYDPAGRKAAISAIVHRVLENRVNQPGAFVDPPPRAMPLKRHPSR
ncbi:MAG: capsular biosynthesis protein [Methylobacterium sp.]|nr:capsular biosynthesis protein [Methylobacterium sp.]MCA3604500.1 capsular biosynthesis protein [Methylobacterium sp.]MCA3616124.1 capsular biosynthesis protein [Methylobacterium sp.]MCA3628093.1 capsular biosynthesis protein [Methylobacterium sp.]MCA4909208.1 capsular biosynthesis protein [Methylobacterium sp.]